MFDKEKLLAVFDQTTKTGTDPVRTRGGRLSVASELADSGLTASSTAQSPTRIPPLPLYSGGEGLARQTWTAP